MSIAFLDIETCPQSDLIDVYTDNIKPRANLKDLEKIASDIQQKLNEAQQKMCTDINFNEIRMIGIWFEGKYLKLSLKEWIAWQSEHQGITYITYNGIKFDFPVIIRNIIKQGLACPKSVLVDLRDYTRRFPIGHTDLMNELCEYGEWKSLDLLAQVYLGEKKVPIDFMTCSDKELTDHNKHDLILLEKLYWKFEQFI
jgi:DNA polymerase elongation subunit (family B)